MDTEQKIVEEIAALWTLGDKESARLWVKLHQQNLSPRIYKYLREKTGIIEEKEVPELAIRAQNILRGKLFDQYGVEIDDFRIIKPIEEMPPFIMKRKSYVNKKKGAPGYYEDEPINLNPPKRKRSVRS